MLKLEIRYLEVKMQLLRRETILITIAIVWPVLKSVIRIRNYKELQRIRNYNITRNVNSGFSIVSMCRVRFVKIRFFELGIVKHYIQRF